MQTLNFIGIGSAFNNKLGNTSAFIKSSNNLLLIDCGEDVFKSVLELKLLNNSDNINVLITHLHPDHVGSLGSLIFYCALILKKKAKVYFPNKESLQQLLLLQGASVNHYDFISEKLINGLNLSFQEFPVFHVDMFKDNWGNVYYGNEKQSNHIKLFSCYGYKINYNDKNIYFSGDSYHIEPEDINGLQKGLFDEFYQDTCGVDYPGNAHLSLNLLSNLIEPNLRSKVFCMHIDEALNINEVKKRGFNLAEKFY